MEKSEKIDFSNRPKDEDVKNTWGAGCPVWIFGNGKSDVFGRSANGTIIIKASYLFDIIRTKRKPAAD